MAAYDGTASGARDGSACVRDAAATRRDSLGMACSGRAVVDGMQSLLRGSPPGPARTCLCSLEKH
jgi:hypothetical protein